MLYFQCKPLSATLSIDSCTKFKAECRYGVCKNCKPELHHPNVVDMELHLKTEPSQEKNLLTLSHRTTDYNKYQATRNFTV